MEVIAEGVLSQETGPYNEQDLQTLEQSEQQEQQEELIGGKFKSAEDLLEAYQQLEKRLGRQPQDSQEDQTDTPEDQEQPEEISVLSEEQETTIVESIGGSEQFTAVQDWAKENLDPEELEAYNREVNSGDYYRARNALQSLHYAYQDNTGSEPELLGGKLSANSNDVFRSTAEVMEAMNDPRYDRDPAYRNDIMEKLARSEVKF